MDTATAVTTKLPFKLTAFRSELRARKWHRGSEEAGRRR
jgi:hypothetical protein